MNDQSLVVHNLQHNFYPSCTLSSIRSLASVLSTITNLKRLVLSHMTINDEILQEIAFSINGLSQLEYIDISENKDIGKIGCEALANVIQNPNCNLSLISLINIDIDDECASLLANSMKRNKKLKCINFHGHSISDTGWGAFLDVLCNTATVTDTYLSNHSLSGVGECLTRLPAKISLLLRLNEDGNEKRVATRKILIHHPILDMEPFLEWDTKILPYAVMWFDRARVYARENRRHIEDYDIGEDCIETRKLDGIYHFARAVPLLFVPTPKKAGAKRKIGEAR